MSNLIFSPSDLPKLLAEGGKPSRSGLHALWVWAKNSARLRITLDRSSFLSPPQSGPAGAMAWRRVGEAALKKNRRFHVEITAERRYLQCKPDLIGRLVLSPDASFDPSLATAMTQAMPDSPGPVGDARLTLDRGTNTHFRFPKYETLREWEARAADLREHILVSSGLWPMPERCPLNAHIFGRTEREDYTVEKVYFESYPGFYVTGNLYRPKHKAKPVPGIANPHGHWAAGRLANEERGSVPGRCINFAKQGYVAFSYDMVGKVDSRQVPHDFRTDAADLWGINLLGLQLWNSIRVVDFLQSLPDVDPERIGCTGTSGGGTQTFMLMAVDERVKVAAPVCMVSGIMQGGCLCENAPGLRIDTYNAEIAALMAPRPLLLVAATGDWTRLNPEEEYPGIRSIYRLYAAQDKVKCIRFDAEHNYNKDSREAVYKWFARWLLGKRGYNRVREVPFAAEKERDLRVFPDGELPSGALDTNGVVASVQAIAKKGLALPKPSDAAAFKEFRANAEIGLRHALAAAAPSKGEVEADARGKLDAQGFSVERLVLGHKGVGDRVPAILFRPDGSGKKPCVVAVHGEGKRAFVDETAAKPGPFIEAALAKGLAVLAIDVFLTGEHHSVFEPTRWDTSEKHFWTFHPTAAAERVQDILTAAAYARSRKDVSRVTFAGFAAAGLWALFAGALDPQVQAVVVDADQFDTGPNANWAERFWTPSLRRVGDISAAAAILAPTRLLIHNTAGEFDTTPLKKLYTEAKAPKSILAHPKPMANAAITKWLAG